MSRRDARQRRSDFECLNDGLADYKSTVGHPNAPLWLAAGVDLLRERVGSPVTLRVIEELTDRILDALLL